MITKHLHKTFIAKIKVDHRKWPSFVINASESGFFLLKICRNGQQKINLSKPYSTKKKLFYKIMKNSQVGAGKLKKTAEFVISLMFSRLKSS